MVYIEQNKPEESSAGFAVFLSLFILGWFLSAADLGTPALRLADDTGKP